MPEEFIGFFCAILKTMKNRQTHEKPSASLSEGFQTDALWLIDVPIYYQLIKNTQQEESFYEKLSLK